MNILPSKPWLRGGIIGVITCVALAFFYIFAYFPIIEKTNPYDDDTLPAWSTIPPVLTGHIFPLFSSFIVPYGFLCEFSETTCSMWSSDEVQNSVPWTLEGQAGYCITSKSPTSSCAESSEKAGFFAFSFLLLAIYFFIGAIIGKIRTKRHD